MNLANMTNSDMKEILRIQQLSEYVGNYTRTGLYNTTKEEHL